jgi:hypothetical protein
MSKFTYDTNILRIREVTALSSSNSAFIQPGQIPMIAQQGALKWYSTLEFFSTMSVPSLSCSVLDILSSVQPGISTMSSIQTSTFTTFLRSTVAGLGSAGLSQLGQGYVSTSKLNDTVAMLSYNYGYISATTLYDCLTSLGSLRNIGDNFGPMARIGSNFTGGYVSTLNPGEYTIYLSTVYNEGGNLFNTSITNGDNRTSAQIRVAGFSNHLVATSKMTVDVMANLQMNFAGNLTGTCYVSSYLTAVGDTKQIGEPVRLAIYAGASNCSLANLRYLLKKSDLTPCPDVLQVHHVANFTNPGANTATITTWIPEQNGLFLTLNNVD